jgi:hypothetical protein
MKAKTLIILLTFSIVLIALIPSFIALLCEMEKCSLCGVINYNTGKWLKAFTGIFVSELLAFIAIASFIAVVLSLKDYPEKSFIKFKLYNRYKMFESPHCLLFDYLKRAFSDGILKPKIYTIS